MHAGTEKLRELLATLGAFDLNVWSSAVAGSLSTELLDETCLVAMAAKRLMDDACALGVRGAIVSLGAHGASPAHQLMRPLS